MIESTINIITWCVTCKNQLPFGCKASQKQLWYMHIDSFLSHQISLLCTHSGAHLPEFFAPHPRGAGDGGGGSPDLERYNVPAGSDQMGLSADIWLTPFLHVKFYHGSGSVDSPRPPGSLCCGCPPRGKSLKNNLDTCAL